jgi:hypothetical protein
MEAKQEAAAAGAEHQRNVVDALVLHYQSVRVSDGRVERDKRLREFYAFIEEHPEEEARYRQAEAAALAGAAAALLLLLQVLFPIGISPRPAPTLIRDTSEERWFPAPFHGRGQRSAPIRHFLRVPAAQ